MYKRQNKEKFERCTLNVRFLDLEKKCVNQKEECLPPEEKCKFMKYVPPPPPICVNNYPKKKGKKRGNEEPANINQTKTIVGNNKFAEKKPHHAVTNDELQKYYEKLYSQQFFPARKKVEYIDYKGLEKRRSHRQDYLTGPPLPVVFDTTPNYYAKVDAQKTTCSFYCHYLNSQLWKLHKPKPPILLGADKRHLFDYVNENDYLYKFLKQKEGIQRKRKRKKRATNY